MTDPIYYVLIFTTVLLSLVIITFLVLLIIVLLMVKRSLKKLDHAIDHVEDTAIRSLAPFLTFKSMFSDVNGMVQSVKSWVHIFDTNTKKAQKLLKEIKK